MMDWNLCPLCASNLQTDQPDLMKNQPCTSQSLMSKHERINAVLYLSSSLTLFDHLQMFFPLMKRWQLLLSLQNQMQRFSINSRAVNAADSARLIFERRWNVFKMQSEEKTAVRIKLFFFLSVSVFSFKKQETGLNRPHQLSLTTTSHFTHTGKTNQTVYSVQMYIFKYDINHKMLL